MGDSNILKTFFESAEKVGFFNVSYAALAQILHIEEDCLHEEFPDRVDFLKALHGEIEDTLLNNFQEDPSDMSMKDKLFDLLMLRIEALEPYRQGVSRFIQESEKSPLELKFLPIVTGIVPLMLKGMENLLISLNGEGQIFTQKNRAVGLLIVYVLVLHTWAEDKTLDLSKTMHALDRYLGLFTEQFGENL